MTGFITDTLALSDRIRGVVAADADFNAKAEALSAVLASTTPARFTIAAINILAAIEPASDGTQTNR